MNVVLCLRMCRGCPKSMWRFPKLPLMESVKRVCGFCVIVSGSVLCALCRSDMNAAGSLRLCCCMKNVRV